jgi:heme exporter protein B
MEPLAAPRRPTWFAQAWLVAKKDLLIELQTGEVVITGGFFAILVTVIASLSLWTGPQNRNEVAAAVIWLAIAFAAVLALSRTWQREREESALDALLVSPISPSAIYCGKALGVLAFLFVIELLVIPTCALFFSLDILEFAWGLVVLCAIATPGVAASGTLFGLMTVRTRARDLVLSIVLFPLLAPTLLAATVATRLLFDGDVMGEVNDFLRIMMLFDLIFTAGGLSLFGTLAEQ